MALECPKPTAGSSTDWRSSLDCELAQTFVSWSPALLILTLVAYTLLIIWGSRKLGLVLSTTEGAPQLGGDAGDGSASVPDVTALRTALAEPGLPGNPLAITKIGVFMGSVGLAALFTGIGYWIIVSLYLDPGNLSQLEGIWTYFLAGSAMFLPYAFDRLSKLFGG